MSGRIPPKTKLETSLSFPIIYQPYRDSWDQDPIVLLPSGIIKEIKRKRADEGWPPPHLADALPLQDEPLEVKGFLHFNLTRARLAVRYYLFQQP